MSDFENRAELTATGVAGERVALMPIHPGYANGILDGTKGAEFRKRQLAPDIKRIVIYATAPISRIIGEFTIGETVLGSPDEIWRAFGSTGQISESSFHKYFEARETAVAFVVTRAHRYPESIALADLNPRPGIPQSTIYLAADLFAGR